MPIDPKTIVWDDEKKPGAPQGIVWGTPAPAPQEDNRNFVQKLGTGLHQASLLASKGITDTAKFLAGDYLSKPFQVLNEYATSKGYPLTPTDQQIEQGKADVEKAGNWAKAGQFGGQVALEALTAPVVEAKMAAAGSKMLPQAVNYLAKPAAQVGSNAAVAATMAPENKGEQALGAAEGTVYGSALAKTLGKAYEYGKRGVGRIVEEVSPKAAAVDARALRAIENTVGKDEVARATTQLENPNPSMLPRTTAAMADSSSLGAMEKGARGRMPDQFKAHDQNVDVASWDFLKKATPEADQVKNLQGQHTKIFNEGQARLDKLPFSKANRELISKQLRELRASNMVSGDASGQSDKAIDAVLRAVDKPDTSLGVLAHLHSTLDGTNPGIARVKTIIKDVADARSKGEFTNVLEGYKTTSEAIEAAEKSAKLRNKFMGPDNVPQTSRYWGESGTPSAVPGLDSAPLRRATAANDPTNPQLGMLADALRSKDIHNSPGSSTINRGPAEEIAVAGINTGPLWRLRGTIKSAFGPINEKTTQAIDEALLDPQKFLGLIEARRLKQEALKPWEAKLEKIIRSGGQIGARIGGPAGE